MEANLLRHLAGRRKETEKQFAELVGADAVVIMFPFSPRFDHPRNAQQCQMVADGGLALPEPSAKFGDVELVILSQEKEDPEACLITQQFEDLSEFSHGLFGNLSHGFWTVGLRVGAWFGCLS